MTTFYICTNKDFNIPEGLKGNYKIITDGTELTNKYPYSITKANNELTPLKHAYSEGHMIYEIWKNDTDSDYIGINHYRRFLDIQFKEEVQENVLPIPWGFNLYNQYAACHNIKDLDECIDIINKHYPQYNTNVLLGYYPCNICILDRSAFNEWCEFIFGVLDIFNERKGFTCDEDVRNYVRKTFKEDKVDYQSRLHGFLLERLSTIFFVNKFQSKKRYN